MINLNIATLKSTTVAAPQTNNPITPLMDYSPVLLLAFTALATYHFSKKQLRKMKRKMLWQALKSKFKSGSGKGRKIFGALGKILTFILLLGALFTPQFVFSWAGLAVLGITLLFLGIGFWPSTETENS